MALNGSLATKDAAGKLVTDLSLAIVGWNGGTPMTASAALGIGTSGIGPYYNAGLAYYGERLAASSGPVTNWIAGLPVDALGRVVVANAAVTNYAPNGVPLTAAGFVAVTTAASGDTEAPTTPTSLVATPVSDTQINLTWTPAVDNVGVVGYVVERCTGAACVNFAQINTSATNAYNDPTVVGATAYRYRVAGYDAAANVSAYSNVADATTSATPPIAQSAADVVTAADLLAQLVERVSADVIAVAETFQTASAKALAEALVSTDALVWVLSQALADAVSANDAVAFMLAKSYDEAVVTADANFMDVGRASSDFTSTVDSVGFSGAGGTNLTDTTAASDALSWLMDTFRGDAPTVTDVAALMASKEFFENIGLADALTQLLTKALADAVASAETMDQLMDRITADVTTSTDALARGLNKDALTDGVASTDNATFTLSQALSTSLTDGVTSTDNVTPVLSGGFSPADLFAAGELGMWYDFSDFSTMFTDTAGTTPVTAAGQSVARVNDKSGRGNHLTQGTAASQPKLEARVNAVVFSEDLANAAWLKTLTTVTSNVAAAPTSLGGAMTADGIIPSASAGLHWVQYTTPTVPASGKFCYSVYVKTGPGGSGKCSIVCVSGGTAEMYVSLTIATSGVTMATSGSFPGTVSGYGADAITADGWVRVWIAGNPDITTTTRRFRVQCQDAAGQANVAFDGTTTQLYVFGAQIEPGVGPPSRYQWSTAAATYDTTGFPWYLNFDGTDDFLAGLAAYPAPNTDKLTIWAGIHKANDILLGSILEPSPDPNGNPGSWGILGPGNDTKASYSFRTRGGGASLTIGETPLNFPAPRSDVISCALNNAGATNALKVTGRVRGVAQTLTLTGAAGTGNYASLVPYVGRRGGTALPYNGKIYGLIARFTTSTAQQITDAEQWMAGKVGISF
jgi:hypothetical protein